jgi:hypothetical protein
VNLFGKSERRRIFERKLNGKKEENEGSVGMTFNKNLKDILSISGVF